jgi:TrmH family RNA methyltransferase
VITSRQHHVVKQFKNVARGSRTHALLDGWHLLREAAGAGLTIETVAIADTPPAAADKALLDRIARTASVISVSASVLDALSPVRTPSGVVALVHRREFQLGELVSAATPLVLIAVDVQDPGNVGGITRAAEAGGATGVVLAGVAADPWSWKSLRAAMGSTFRLPVIRHADALTIGDELRSQGLRLIAATPRDGAPMHQVDLRNGCAVLLGGEGGGLPGPLLANADARLSIPMRQPVESLNVAVAAGVLIYEAHRQRHQPA